MDHSEENELRKRREREVIKGLSEILVLGGLYLVWVSLTHIGIPCPFHLLTGYQCPGCGITHCALSLARGDLAGAWKANAFVLTLLPFGLVYGGYRTRRYIRNGKTDYSLLELVVFAILLLAAIVFAIKRNG